VQVLKIPALRGATQVRAAAMNEHDGIGALVDPFPTV
jgi:hypothetical protein